MRACVRVRVRVRVCIGVCRCVCVCGRLPVYECACLVERGSSVVECRTRNRVSPGSNPPLVPFGRLGILLLSIDAPVHSAV